MYKFLMIIGGFITAFSVFFVTAAAGDLMTGSSDTQPEVLWGLLVFFSMSGLSGLYLCINSRAKDRRRKREEKERLVLRLIAEKKGRIMPVEMLKCQNFPKKLETEQMHLTVSGTQLLQQVKVLLLVVLP